MQQNSRIYVAGHSGLVGSAICRKLIETDHNNIIVRTHSELDLCDAIAVDTFFKDEQPEYVFLAAAVVGGIHANDTQAVRFLRDNILIQTNVIESAYRHGVKKLAFLGSTCIYPRDCPQPIKEEYLLTGPLEETNQWYAIAKIAGIKLCQAYHKEFGFNAIS
ncbi:MAG: NAD-dependent epimerase/dehydratase family protein, partial [Pseudomonadota bacterium]